MISYTTNANDTWASLAAYYGVSVATLQAANPSAPVTLVAGVALQVPSTPSAAATPPAVATPVVTANSSSIFSSSLVLLGGAAALLAAYFFFSRKKSGGGGGTGLSLPLVSNPKRYPRWHRKSSFARHLKRHHKKKKLRKKRGKRKPMKVQALIFPKSRYTRKKAMSWARAHGYSARKVHATGRSYRIRQHATISFGGSGIKAVVGKHGRATQRKRRRSSRRR
jgi:LysM repeat protein